QALRLHAEESVRPGPLRQGAEARQPAFGSFRALTQRHAQILLLAIAHYVEAELVTRLVLLDGFGKSVPVPDLQVAHFGDQVAGLETGLGGRTVRLDLVDAYASLLGTR